MKYSRRRTGGRLSLLAHMSSRPLSTISPTPEQRALMRRPGDAPYPWRSASGQPLPQNRPMSDFIPPFDLPQPVIGRDRPEPEGDGPVPLAASLCGVPIGEDGATCCYRARVCPIHDYRERGEDQALRKAELMSDPEMQLAIGQLKGRLFHGIPPASDDEWKLAELIFDDVTLQEIHRWRFLLSWDDLHPPGPPDAWKGPKILG